MTIEMQRKITKRKIQQLLSFEEIFQNEPKFPTYYVINFPGVDINSNLNVIAADNELKNKIGSPKRITKMIKNALHMQITSKDQITRTKTNLINRIESNSRN